MVVFGKIGNKIAVKISGNNFQASLKLLKSLPVREYKKAEKTWLISIRDLATLYNEIKNYDGVVFPYWLRHEYDKYTQWYKNQIRLKKDNDKYFGEMDNLKLPLRTYQTVGAKFIYEAKGGLIADKVGLGKTAQALSVVEKLNEQGHIIFCIVLCPSTLKKNWENEIHKFTDKKVVLVDGTPKKRKDAYKKEIHYRGENVNDYIIISYESLIKDHIIIDLMAGHFNGEFALIMDEIQYIKNSTANRSKKTKALSELTEYKIGLSATAIENTIFDLWSELQAINPDYLGGKDNYVQFMKRYVKTGFWGEITGYKNIDELKRRIAPVVIRRRKEDVLDQLPELIENNYWIKLSKKQREMYDEVEDNILDAIQHHHEDEEPIAKIGKDKDVWANYLTQIIYLRQCVLDCRLVDYSISHSTKLAELTTILESIDLYDKVVIFCHFVGMIDYIEQHLADLEIPCMKITGQNTEANERVGLVDKFNKSPDINILVASDVITVGLNITGAAYIINFDMLYNPAKMEQRVGRLDRIGNVHPKINVINLIAENTVENRMYEVWKAKESDAMEILDDGEFEARMTFRDIRDLFRME